MLAQTCGTALTSAAANKKQTAKRLGHTRTPPPKRVCDAPLTTISMIGASLFVSGKALALDLDKRDGLITNTIASNDRLKHYDNIKKYGAERVLDRDRRYLKPDGLRAENYLVFPSFSTDIIFDDNIFGRDVDKRSDIRFELNPETNFQSRFSRHVLNFSLGGKIVKYSENSDQDYEDIRGSVDGALHFDHAHTLAVRFLSERTHKITDLTQADRDLIETTGLIHGPVPEVHHNVAIGITRDAGRLYGTLSASADRVDYEDVRGPNGTIIDQDIRDTDILSTQLYAAYRFSPGYELVTKLRYLRQFNEGVNGLDRDSSGYEALAGLAFETNPLLRWRLIAGVSYRDFDNDALSDITSSVFEGEVQWLPTQRMTITANLQRELVDTVNGDIGSSVETTVSGRLDYDVYHNIVLSLRGEYTEKDFAGTSREDEEITAGIQLSYLMNKNWVFTFAYEHEFVDSTDDLLDATRNQFLVGAKIQF